MKRELPSEIGDLLSGAGLAILAKQIVDGFLIGLHRGTRRGTGTEFSQYRSYQPGDDIRLIDWKMFARSDRYYIKESETETSIIVRFFLDASSSMEYREQELKRIDYSALVIASLATLAHRQGDSVGLHIVHSQNRIDTAPKREKSQLNRLYSILESVECEGTWPETTEWITECTSRHRELWIFCSDMLDDAESWRSIREMGEAFGHEMLFFQILGETEQTLSLNGVTTVQDPESREERTIRAASVKETYLENLNKYLEELEDSLTGRRSVHQIFSMNRPVQDLLRAYLQNRSRL
ncbi:MAG: DUF58 domain-containing protein [Bacteroidota bacterium]